jgi:phage baseplate assembly protein W
MATGVSRYFKDISLSFNRHPITNDIVVISNEDAIKKSVQNLVRTRINERFFNSLLGSNATEYIFELTGTEVEILLENEIQTLLENFETRIRVSTVQVEASPDDNELNITIAYDIVGLPLPSQNLEFILQPTRV